MSVVRRYPHDEFARLGKKRYAEIRDQFTDADKGKFLAIDIETGDFEVGQDEIEICVLLRERNPGAQIWGERIGYKTMRTMGGRSL